MSNAGVSVGVKPRSQELTYSQDQQGGALMVIGMVVAGAVAVVIALAKRNR